MSTVTVRAVIYLRVSLDTSGEGLAVERQLEDCRRIADARGWSICEIYTEKPISAFAETKKRPAYDRMVEDYPAGRLNALITWDLDRLPNRSHRHRGARRVAPLAPQLRTQASLSPRSAGFAVSARCASCRCPISGVGHGRRMSE
ncbi:recombinase family protein [Nocardia tengchongensis]|uniref:recombinase family protein n=1 Tax=Nocardia tengchongensis TaxID=2055889 RepID=UPI0036555F9F